MELITSSAAAIKRDFESDDYRLGLNLPAVMREGDAAICYLMSTADVSLRTIINRLPLLSIFTEALLAGVVRHDVRDIRTFLNADTGPPVSVRTVYDNLVMITQRVYRPGSCEAMMHRWQFCITIRQLPHTSMFAVTYVLAFHDRAEYSLDEPSTLVFTPDLPSSAETNPFHEQLVGGNGRSEISSCRFPPAGSRDEQYFDDHPPAIEWRGVGYETDATTSRQLRVLYLGYELQRIVLEYAQPAGSDFPLYFDEMLSRILRLREEMVMMTTAATLRGIEESGGPASAEDIGVALSHLEVMRRPFAVGVAQSPVNRLSELLSYCPSTQVVINWLRAEQNSRPARSNQLSVHQVNERALSRIIPKGVPDEHKPRESASPGSV